MMHIFAAPCFLLILAASGRAEDSSRSLLSERDEETIRTAKTYHKTCNLKHGGTHAIHTHVFHVYDGGSGWKLTEKNAGDTLGDLSFVLSPRGVGYYDDGYISLVHVALTGWGQYLKCHHESQGSHRYTCGGGSQTKAGRERQGDGWWYSFPAKGEGKDWWQSYAKSGPCAKTRIKAKCLFNLMAKAGGCSHGCDGTPFKKCYKKCMQGLSMSQQRTIWDHAFFGHGCMKSLTDELNATSEMDDPVLPEGAFTNTSHSEAPRAPLVIEAGTTDDNFTDTAVASTDNIVVV